MTRHHSASVFIDETQRFSWESRRRTSRCLLVESRRHRQTAERKSSRREAGGKERVTENDLRRGTLGRIRTEESDDERLRCRRHFGRNKIVVSFDTRIGLLEGFRLKGRLSEAYLRLLILARLPVRTAWSED